MAASVRTTGTGGGTSGTSNRTCAITTAVGDLIVVFCAASGNTLATPTCSDNGSIGSGYTLVGTALWGTSANIMSVFVSNTRVTAALATTITVATGSNTAAEIVAYALSGVEHLAIGAIWQHASQANQAASTTPAPTFTNNALTGNIILSAVANTSDPATMTVTSGSTPTWTKDQDLGQATPSTGLATEHTNSGFTSKAITWGSTSGSTFASFALEIDSSNSISVVSGSYADTGTAVTLKHGYKVSAASSTFVESGTAETLEHGYKISAASGTFAETGTAETLTHGYKVSAASGTFAENGTAEILEHGYPLTASSGTFAETGTAETLLWKHKISLASGTFVETGTAETLEHGYKVSAASSTFVESGTAETLEHGYKISAASGTFAETGTAETLTHGYKVSAASGTFAENGTAEILEHGYPLTASSGTFVETGTAETLLWKHTISLASGTFVETGHAVTLLWTHAVSLASGTFVETGTAETLLWKLHDLPSIRYVRGDGHRGDPGARRQGLRGIRYIRRIRHCGDPGARLQDLRGLRDVHRIRIECRSGLPTGRRLQHHGRRWHLRRDRYQRGPALGSRAVCRRRHVHGDRYRRDIDRRPRTDDCCWHVHGDRDEYCPAAPADSWGSWRNIHRVRFCGRPPVLALVDGCHWHLRRDQLSCRTGLQWGWQLHPGCRSGAGRAGWLSCHHAHHARVRHARRSRAGDHQRQCGADQQYVWFRCYNHRQRRQRSNRRKIIEHVVLCSPW